jgi:hypothetical protein
VHLGATYGGGPTAWLTEQLREEAREVKVEKRRGKDLSKA